MAKMKKKKKMCKDVDQGKHSNTAGYKRYSHDQNRLVGSLKAEHTLWTMYMSNRNVYPCSLKDLYENGPSCTICSNEKYLNAHQQ